MSFIKRYQSHLRYLSDMTEDILAVTLFFPLTLALHVCNSVADTSIELPSIFGKMSSPIWKTSKFLLTAPLYALTGILTLTLVAPLAMCLSIPESDHFIERRYTFPLGRKFEEFAASSKAWLAFSLITERPSFLSFEVTLGLLGLMGASGRVINFILAMSVLLTENVLALFAFIVLKRVGSMSIVFGMAALAVLQVDVAYGVCLWALPFYMPALSMIFAAPLLISIPLASSLTLGWFEAKTSWLSQKSLFLIEDAVDFMKRKLFKRHKYAFKNTYDIVANDLSDISEDNWFITDDNYVLNLENLGQVFESYGFVNPHIEDRATGRLSLHEVERLERVRGIHQFPRLQAFIKEHKKELNPVLTSALSMQSIHAIRHFAYALRASQHYDNFLAELTVARDKFDTHLENISSQERAMILDLNLLGGSDPNYTFRNVMEGVAKDRDAPGSFCKKGGATLMLETCDRLEAINRNGKESKVFWQQENPTHWMRAGRVLVR